MAGEFWLDDRQWARLQSMLPNKPRGVPRVDDRRVISGIVHVLQSGCRWKDAPSIYGPPKMLYNRNVRWAAKGVWRAVFEALAAEGGPPTQGLISWIGRSKFKRIVEIIDLPKQLLTVVLDRAKVVLAVRVIVWRECIELLDRMEDRQHGVHATLFDAVVHAIQPRSSVALACHSVGECQGLRGNVLLGALGTVLLIAANHSRASFPMLSCGEAR